MSHALHSPRELDRPLASERLEIAAFCNGASRALGDELPHQLFERQVASRPGAPALRFRDQVLTYGELNARANALARALADKGIGAERRVMVCLEPSFDVVIALLGILKAGAVYLPIDPASPVARLQALVADATPALLITGRSPTAARGLVGVELLVLDDAGPLPGSGEANPGLAVHPEHTACIYYTSGTTGLPKGAMASQANLRHSLRVAQERYRIRASDVMPAVARFSFSISMFELLSPLIAGGTLLLLDREHVMDPARMSRTLGEVTFFHIGPSLLKPLIAHINLHFADYRSFSGVRHASTGGDLVPSEVLDSLRLIFSRAEVFVIYGCTEISCMGCTYPAQGGRRPGRHCVGRPFDNQRVRILDASRNLVPFGAVGEICFSGGGVVKGYLNRPELTAERFFQWEGNRYYRTGDLGRLGEDGWIEILGRQDFQVQVRGMRIELGEIEHHLRRAPGVKDGVVVARDTGDGEKTLVAYVVGDPAEGRGSADRPRIRQHLREQLPEYMVPSAYVELDRLPLNANLKLDRQSLPEPGPADRRLDASPAGDACRAEPRTPTELALAALWRDSLDLAAVGVDDHFFDLGGDSLRAIALIARVESELGARLGGLEVVRESLGTLAGFCDLRRGTPALPAPQLQRPARRHAPVDSVELIHFGAARSLHGAFHPATPDGDGAAALICAPLGPEGVRAHFVLQRLARRLAARGVAVLRFDYFGHGDSLGDSEQGSCRRWEDDIVCAWQELQTRSCARAITAIGVRLGAALLGRVLDRIDAARWVLWDPVFDGEAYVKELTLAHESYLRNVRYRRRWEGAPTTVGCVELAGATYSAVAIREMRALTVAPEWNRRLPPLAWLETSSSAERRRLFQALSRGDGSSRLETVDRDCGWGAIERAEQILPDVGISRSLLELSLE